VIATLSTSSSAVALNLAPPPARADSAVADYSRHVAGELAVVRTDADRDELDLAGHRVTELRLDEVAA
jgi:hypothetical protein